MNIQLVIADDEYFIRQRLKKIIPWEHTDLSLTLAGEVSNGLELLDLLKHTTVDIILLDIKMPKMTGLDSAKKIHALYPHIQIIILSGFNEFEYARTAMRFGISHYLLKPVESAALEAALKDCVQKIHSYHQEQSRLQNSYHYEMCSMISSVLSKQKTPSDFFHQYPRCSSYRYGLFLGLFIKENQNSFILKLASAFHAMGLFCEYFHETDYTSIFFIFTTDKSSISHIESFLTDTIASTDTYTFMTAGNFFDLSDNWIKPYRRVLHLLLLRYFQPESILHLEYESLPERELYPDSTKLRQKLILLINTKKPDEFELFLSDLFSDIYQKRNLNYMQLLITEILLTYTICYPDKIDSNLNITEFVSGLFDEEHSLEPLKEILVSYGLQCMRSAAHSPSDIYLSQKIRSYIQQHYTDPALSVSTLAETFRLNASYMGTLFKKINNQSILQYLIEVRMEAAKELILTSNYRISDVAEMVGYTDVFYFSKRFKKMYGSSPKDFLHKSIAD